MLRAGTTTFEAKSGYGLDRDTELASLRAIGAAGGVPTFLGAHAVPPEFAGGDDYLDFLIADVLPEAAASPRPRTSSSSRAPSTPTRRALSHRGEAARARAPAPRGSVHRSRRISLAVELGASSVDHLEATGDEGVRAVAQSEVTAVLLRSARSSSTGRCRRRASSSTPAPLSRLRRTSIRSAFCESLVRLLARMHPAGPVAGRALTACTVNAAHVLSRADRKGRLAPGYDADIVLLEAPDWRYLAYHLAGDVVAGVIEDGQTTWRR